MSSKIPLAREWIKQVADELEASGFLRDKHLALRLREAERLMHRAKPDFVSPKTRPTPTAQQKALARHMRDNGHSYDDIEVATGMQRGRISTTVNPPS